MFTCNRKGWVGRIRNGEVLRENNGWEC
jgi:hypothetical protein